MSALDCFFALQPSKQAGRRSVGPLSRILYLAVPVTGLDCHFCFAEMHSSHPFLNWWQQHPAGVLRFRWVRVLSCRHQYKRGGKSLPFCIGAGDRTRTGTPSLAVDFESRNTYGI